MAISQTLAEQITAAIGAHGAWKTRLMVAIETGRSEFVVDVVRKDDQCPFGKWLHGGIDASSKASQHYPEVKSLHAAFHKEAAAVLAQAVGGKKAEAKQAMGLGQAYARASSSLTAAMMAWQRASR